MVRNLSSIINFKRLSSDLPEWKKCGRILFLSLVVPWLLVIGLTEWISWQAGDWLSMSQAAALQTRKPDLIWYKERVQNFGRFKMARVAIDRPDILILGQCRSQFFRSAMFRPYSAYNFSTTCYLIPAFTDLLHHLPPGYNPKMIIFTCDFWYFSPQYSASMANYFQNFTTPWTDKLDDLRDILVQLPKHPDLLFMGFNKPHGYPTLGLDAYLSAGGFRKDGSTKWGLRENNADSLISDPAVANLGGSCMGSTEMEQFKEFVSEAQARGIALVGVQLPIRTEEQRYMEEHNANFADLQDFNDHVKSGYFDKLGVLFFNFLNFAGYSDNPQNFLDVVHPKENTTLAVLSAMASDPRFLALLPKLNVAALKENLAQGKLSQEHLDLYPNEF
jgi:hypothetical protein